MNLLIIEPEYRGHHIALHLNLILEEGLKRDWNISILTCKSLQNSKAYELIKKKNIKKIKFYYLKENKFKSRRDIFYLLYILYVKYKNIFNKIILKNRIDHIYFITLDHIDKILTIKGLLEKEIYFSGMQIYSRIYLEEKKLIKIFFLAIKKIFFYRLLKLSNLKNLFVVDNSLFQFCKKKQLKKIVYVPDPGVIHYKITKTLSRKKLRINIKKDFVILVYGAIKKSKGIYPLVNAIKKIKNKNIKVILAGEQTEEVKNFLKQDENLKLIINKKILIFEGFKNYYEESLFFSVADVVWVAYSDDFFGSSSVLYQAGLLKKPVITNKIGLLSYINKKNKIGICTNINNENDIIKSIMYLYFSKNTRKVLGLNNFYLSKKHSGENFSKIICDKLINDSGK